MSFAMFFAEPVIIAFWFIELLIFWWEGASKADLEKRALCFIDSCFFMRGRGLGI